MPNLYYRVAEFARPFPSLRYDTRVRPPSVNDIPEC